MYVDVHTHLTHQDFASDRSNVIDRARRAGLDAIIVNGLEPTSNRMTLDLARQYPIVKPALGIYPLDAVNHLLSEDFSIRVKRFDVEAEIKFIEERALAGELIAIGECGLDGYWLGQETFAAQERVFEALIAIAKKSDLPLIIHTRKLEQRAAEILTHHQVQKVNFHCFGGRTKLAQRCAEQQGWWFSIPANARKNGAFAKMLRTLPPDKILTETDAPYLSPERGTRNEPANVVGTVAFLAELRGWSIDQATETVHENFKTLFGEHWIG